MVPVCGLSARIPLRVKVLAALLVFGGLFNCSSRAFAAPAIDGLIQTTGFNELTSYDAAEINQSGFFGFNADFVAPLNTTNLLPQNGIVSIANQGSTVYGLIRTPGFNELTAYDRNQINQSGFFGFDAKLFAPLNITNLLPQNSIVSIAASGNTLYGLIRTGSFNELTAYDVTQINQSGFFGFDAQFVAPLDITNLLPQNSIVSIAVEGSTLYGLIRTANFNELVAYDLNQINQSGFFGFDPLFIAPLNITNLLPQNSITSIAVDGSTLYALIQTSGFNELTAYDLNQINESGFFGFDADFVAPLNITNLLPQNSIISIAVAGGNEDGGGGGSGGGGVSPIPEPPGYALMLTGMMALRNMRGRVRYL